MATGFLDRYGLELSANSARAVEKYVEGVDATLSFNLGGLEAFEAAIVADEGFALGYAALAGVHSLQGNMPKAKAVVARAQELAVGTTRRERQHVEAMAAVVEGGRRGRSR